MTTLRALFVGTVFSAVAVGPVWAQYHARARSGTEWQPRPEVARCPSDPTINALDQLQSRLGRLEQLVDHLASSRQRDEAERDLRELTARLARLEHAAGSNMYQPHLAAAIRSEEIILRARTKGLEGRIEELARREEDVASAGAAPDHYAEDSTRPTFAEYVLAAVLAHAMTRAVPDTDAADAPGRAAPTAPGARSAVTTSTSYFPSGISPTTSAPASGAGPVITQRTVTIVEEREIIDLD